MARRTKEGFKRRLKERAQKNAPFWALELVFGGWLNHAAHPQPAGLLFVSGFACRTWLLRLFFPGGCHHRGGASIGDPASRVPWRRPLRKLAKSARIATDVYSE